MEMKLVKYRTTTESPEYKEITRTAKALGYKLFDAWSPGTPSDWLEHLPEVVTIDTGILFDNQYNTVEGFRVFDWKEEIRWNRDKKSNRREGYYLTGDVEELRKLKEERYKCGYCGKQHHGHDAPRTCPHCVGSEYLTPERFDLLVLQPLAGPKRPGLDETELNTVAESHTTEQAKIKAAWEAGREKRFAEKADKIIAAAKIEAADLIEEANIIALLLRNGIDTENLIYYPHTKRWCFGWRKSMSQEEIMDVESRIRKLPSGSALLETIDFKS